MIHHVNLCINILNLLRMPQVAGLVVLGPWRAEFWRADQGPAAGHPN